METLPKNPSQPALVHESGTLARYTDSDYTPSPEQTMLIGYEQIDNHVENCLEHYENSTDIKSGMEAVQIIQHYPDHYGDIPPQIINELVESLASSQGDTLAAGMWQALDSPLFEQPVRRQVIARIDTLANINDLLKDEFVHAYLTVSAENDYGTTLKALLHLTQGLQ